ncbi:phospholipid carrier-dependent glycosyltransferase [uncultured Actinomyces sp.]|uniref:phospholipid carrier-dependent glycosyltransferase n=1 Tax=uncultured Actinomyces sp. TaxID=249061 RepID=UPI0028DB937D|nr:phospholipid carrier-dependent glycosyltransferase [uncultured Actinomyces sp.]
MTTSREPDSRPGGDTAPPPRQVAGRPEEADDARPSASSPAQASPDRADQAAPAPDAPVPAAPGASAQPHPDQAPSDRPDQSDETPTDASPNQADQAASAPDTSAPDTPDASSQPNLTPDAPDAQAPTAPDTPTWAALAPAPPPPTQAEATASSVLTAQATALLDPQQASAQDDQKAQAPRSEDLLRRLLGLDPLGWTLPVAVRVSGWVATALVTLVAAVTRLVGLGHPSTLVFDEIYYAKDAWSLSHVGYETSWREGADAAFARGDTSLMTTNPSYVVHPQLGKWLISLGMDITGPGHAAGWRLIPAVAGIATVFLLARLTMRLTRSPLLAGLAGLLLAIDGVGITESRIALLDVFIGFFATLSLYCLVRDRQSSRARLARDLAGTPAGTTPTRLHLRPWLLATGVALGLTCSIKWSGLYLTMVVGIIVVAWDVLAMYRTKVPYWFAWGLLVRGSSDFLRTVPVALAVYVAGWWSWFTHPRAYKHGWAAAIRATGERVPRDWLPDPLNDLLEYHYQAYRFHINLHDPHPYMSKPSAWLLQLRPTSFHWLDKKADLPGATCSSGDCVQAITSLGNVAVWWSAFIALVTLLVVLAGIRRDWRAWVPLAGYLGLYVPWFLYWERTIFQFYTVAFEPMVVLALTLMLGQVAGLLTPTPGGAAECAETAALRAGRIGPGIGAPRGPLALFLGFGLTSPRRRWRRFLERLTTSRRAQVLTYVTGVPSWRLRREGVVLTAVVVVLAVACALAWWPIWTAHTVDRSFWYWHMWLPSWI